MYNVTLCNGAVSYNERGVFCEFHTHGLFKSTHARSSNLQIWYSWFVEIYACHMARIEIYTLHCELGEFGVHLNTKCGVSLYNSN